MIKYPNRTELSLFKLKDNEISSSHVKYGLPPDVIFCKNCVISNQRPNSTIEFLNSSDLKKKTINFNEDNICDACSYSFLKEKEIDWNLREKQLIEL